MKLRFNNGKDQAVEFEANDLNSFIEQGISALRTFRILTQRRIHQAEIEKNRLWFDKPELHVQGENGSWLDLGLIKQGENGIAYRDPFTIRFDTQADSLEQIFEKDRELFAHDRR